MENTLIFDHFKDELLAKISELRKFDEYNDMNKIRENKRIVI